MIASTDQLLRIVQVNLRWQAYASSSCLSGTCPGVGDLYNQIMEIGYKINPRAQF